MLVLSVTATLRFDISIIVLVAFSEIELLNVITTAFHVLSRSTPALFLRRPVVVIVDHLLRGVDPLPDDLGRDPEVQLPRDAAGADLVRRSARGTLARAQRRPTGEFQSLQDLSRQATEARRLVLLYRG